MELPVQEMSEAGPPSTADRRHYELRPVLVDARTAHHSRLVEYKQDGTAICRFVEFESLGLPAEIEVSPRHQYPAIRATFDDLNKALSRLSNSPVLPNDETLRSLYEAEEERYEALVMEAHAQGRWEPDYGTYVFDHRQGDLYLIAPARWHRLALVTSNAMISTDAKASLSWQAVRDRLDRAVVGFAGLSVGSNIFEGWMREGRPLQAKVADLDWLELANLNRCERASLRHIAGSRAQRFDLRNPYEVARTPKTSYLAYEHHLVDPYLDLFVYGDGVTRSNIERFLLGDGGEEPKLDILVEETDSLDVKVMLRERCRAHGIDVIMLSDFGHRAHVLWNFFAATPDSPISYTGKDDELHAAIAAVRGGQRSSFTEVVDHLCGPDSPDERMREWLDGRGEQPTSSAPQAGATAMTAGGVGGKELCLHVLGHNEGRTERRIIYDLQRRQAICD